MINYGYIYEKQVLMYSKCPGQDMRKLRVELHKCHHCGAEVEIFTDETG